MSIADLVETRAARRGDTGSTVFLIQRGLRADQAVLQADGEFGDITEKAVISFQQRHHLGVDGEVGEETGAALDAVMLEPTTTVSTAVTSAKTAAPWLAVMRAISGTKEFPGTADNPVILGWVATIIAKYPDLKGSVGWYHDDSIPWCGLATGYCVAASGFKPPKLLLGAGNWIDDWPDGVRLREPCRGAIMVRRRTGGNHVTMYEGEDTGYFYCRGGNQSDAVNVARFPKDDSIRGFMFPKGIVPSGGRVMTTFAEARSVSET
jgi:uncharacterized protein (TIGR02594 family)